MKILIEKTTLNNDEITWITCTNRLGMRLTLCSFGGSIYEWFYEKPMTLSPMDRNTFLTTTRYYGKTVGRVCGRLKNAQYELDGKIYHVDVNENSNCLHGGKEGFAYQNFQYEIKEEEGKAIVIFTYYSKDGEGGFNGNMKITATYVILDNQLEFTSIYEVTADQDTLVNITSHPYFMMDGGEARMADHLVTIPSSIYLPIDNEKIILGSEKVTPYFDFRKTRTLGQNGTIPFEYDHDWVLDEGYEGPAFMLTNPEQTRTMLIYSNAPMVHLYDENEAEDILLTTGKQNVPYTSLAVEFKKNPLESMRIKAFETQTMWIRYVLNVK